MNLWQTLPVFQLTSQGGDEDQEMTVDNLAIGAAPTPPPTNSLTSFISIHPIEPYAFVLKIKVKFILEQATKAQRGSRCIALVFL